MSPRGSASGKEIPEKIIDEARTRSIVEGIFGSSMINQMCMPAQHKRRSTMSMSMNKVPASSYNRKSLVTSNLLSKHSQNMFRRETFYGKVGDRGMMLPLE